MLDADRHAKAREIAEQLARYPQPEALARARAFVQLCESMAEGSRAILRAYADADPSRLVPWAAELRAEHLRRTADDLVREEANLQIARHVRRLILARDPNASPGVTPPTFEAFIGKRLTSATLFPDDDNPDADGAFVLGFEGGGSVEMQFPH